MEERDIHLTVNGSAAVLHCDPGRPLLDVLRHDLGLAGPRFGCGMGLCGACFVLVAGQARSSCDYPVWAAEGKDITTVEGLAAGGGLHPLQRAFLDEQAAQCGYCTAGLIVSAAGLLRATPGATREQVTEALRGNLCRCGTHGRVVAAVMRAAAEMASGEMGTQEMGSGEGAP
jgi:nicotinate dehydrogenase subunit A